MTSTRLFNAAAQEALGACPKAAARERAATRARRNDAGRRPAAKTTYVKERRHQATLREVLAFV